MIELVREFAGNIIQEWYSRKRKRELQQTTPPEWVRHLQPEVSIPKKWYGTSYGGFFVFPEGLTSSSVVYSFGVGKDISFDLGCIRNHSSLVFAFDPTPKSISWIAKQHLPIQFSFFPFGIGKKTGTETFFLPRNRKSVSGSVVSSDVMDENLRIEVPMKSFQDIVSSLGHSSIDLIKMDIEGAEYEVLDSILNTDVFIGQLLVEFHDRMFESPPFRSVSLVNRLKEKGYVVFGVSESFEEVSFIHRSLINEKT